MLCMAYGLLSDQGYGGHKPLRDHWPKPHSSNDHADATAPRRVGEQSTRALGSGPRSSVESYVIVIGVLLCSNSGSATVISYFSRHKCTWRGPRVARRSSRRSPRSSRSCRRRAAQLRTYQHAVSFKYNKKCPPRPPNQHVAHCCHHRAYIYESVYI